MGGNRPAACGLRKICGAALRLMVKRGPCYRPKHLKEKRSIDYFAGLDVSDKAIRLCIVDDRRWGAFT